MPAYFGRVTHPDHLPVPDVETLFCVRHQPDSKDRKVHVHMLIETDLSHKKLRRAYRDVYNIEDRMGVFFTDSDGDRAQITYMLNHDNAEILYVHDSLVPLVKEIQQEVASLQQAKASANQEYVERYAAYEAEQQRIHQDHIDEWGIPPLDTSKNSGYRYVRDRLEYMTQHWFSVQKHYTWDDYIKLVIKYITWRHHDDYQLVYSTYRLKGDIQLLYAKYEGVSVDSARRILGY